MSLFTQINIDKVLAEDRGFEINYHADLTTLKDSIRRVGILQPLRVKRLSGQYQIVSGFRRFACAQELGISELPVIIASSLDDLSFFKMAIEENFFSRSYNLVEKSLILEKLKKKFDLNRDFIVQSFMPFIGLERSEKVLRFYERLVEFDDAIKIYMVRNNIPVHVVENMKAFTPEEQREFVPFLETLRLSVSQLKELFTWAYEISLRDKISVRAFFREPIFQEILQNTSLDRHENLKKFRHHLKLRRYPKLMELETKFIAFKQTLGLPLEAPNFFEENRIKMKLSFRDKKEFDEWIDKMKLASNKSEIDEMMKII